MFTYIYRYICSACSHTPKQVLWMVFLTEPWPVMTGFFSDRHDAQEEEEETKGQLWDLTRPLEGPSHWPKQKRGGVNGVAKGNCDPKGMRLGEFTAYCSILQFFVCFGDNSAIKIPYLFHQRTEPFICSGSFALTPGNCKLELIKWGAPTTCHTAGCQVENPLCLIGKSVN